MLTKGASTVSRVPPNSSIQRKSAVRPRKEPGRRGGWAEGAGAGWGEARLGRSGRSGRRQPPRCAAGSGRFTAAAVLLLLLQRGPRKLPQLLQCALAAAAATPPPGARNRRGRLRVKGPANGLALTLFQALAVLDQEEHVEDEIQAEGAEEEKVGQQAPHLALPEDEAGVVVDVEGGDDLEGGWEGLAGYARRAAGRGAGAGDAAAGFAAPRCRPTSSAQPAVVRNESVT